jgi:hypothetical protein
VSTLADRIEREITYARDHYKRTVNAVIVDTCGHQPECPYSGGLDVRHVDAPADHEQISGRYSWMIAGVRIIQTNVIDDRRTPGYPLLSIVCEPQAVAP